MGSCAPKCLNHLSINPPTTESQPKRSTVPPPANEAVTHVNSVHIPVKFFLVDQTISKTYSLDENLTVKDAIEKVALDAACSVCRRYGFNILDSEVRAVMGDPGHARVKTHGWKADPCLDRTQPGNSRWAMGMTVGQPAGNPRIQRVNWKYIYKSRYDA
jgi:hypothetical protein